ncbi:MAG: hypothetical protein IJ604_11250 [Prevotella sp.]|nr:hypothetical protein [Prevotella sp.]
MKKAIMRNIITGTVKQVHLTMDHPAVQCGIAVWVDEEGRAYFPEDVQNPFYELKEIKEDQFDNDEGK